MQTSKILTSICDRRNSILNQTCAEIFQETRMRKHFQNDPDESTFTQVIVSLGEMKVTFLDDCYLNDSCVRNFA